MAVPSDVLARRPSITRARLRETALIGLLYLGLTLVLTRPGVSRFTTHVMADHIDGAMGVWNLWWVKTALAHGHWPWWTDRLYAPDGVSLYLHTLGMTNALLSLPFQFLLSLTVAHNAVVIASFVLSGMAMYGLVRFLGGDPGAAFLAGTAFTFSPFHFAHGTAHLTLMPMYWLPLYVWGLLAACRTRRTRDAITAGAILWSVVLTEYYFTLYCIIATILVMIWHRTWRLPALAVLVAGVLSLPLAVPMLRFVLTVPLVGSHDPTRYSADVVGWFVPGGVSAWAALSAEIWRRFTGNVAEQGMYLGILPLTIVGLSLWSRVRTCVVFVVAGGVFALLALGPWLHVGGRVLPVPLPYLLLTHLFPFLNLGGAPVRFMVMVYLCLAAVVGLGVTELCRRLNGRQRTVVHTILVVGLLLEYAPQPYTTTRYFVPPFYQALARQPDTGDVVMDLPPDRLQPFAGGMLFQTIHGKRIIGGHIDRTPTAQLEAYQRHPVIRFLYGSLPCSDGLREEMLDRLRRDAVRWIVLRGGTIDRGLDDCLRLPRLNQRVVIIGPVPRPGAPL
jgi:hypothetical protein